MATRSHDPRKRVFECGQIIGERLGGITLTFFLVFTLAALYTYASPRKYRGRVNIPLEQSKDSGEAEVRKPAWMKWVEDKVLQTRLASFTDTRTLDQITDKLNLLDRWHLHTHAEARAKLLGNLEMKNGPSPDLAALEYYDEDPVLAADIVNQLAGIYRENHLTKSTTKSPAETDPALQPTVPEARPRKPDVALNLALGSVAGLLAGLGIAFLLESLDTSVRNPEEAEQLLGIPVLGVIPDKIKILLHSGGLIADADVYRVLRTHLETRRPRERGGYSISVVSGSSGEGKSTTVVNLATVCAQGGNATLIIDADMRHASQQAYFKVSNARGLSQYLSTSVDIQEVVMRTPVENLYLMPSGPLPSDPARLLKSKKFSHLIADMKHRFDVVLLDSPRILGIAEAAEIAAEADLTLLVIEPRKLRGAKLLRTTRAVEQAGGAVLGTVLNKVAPSSPATYATLHSSSQPWVPATFPSPAPRSNENVAEEYF